LQIWLSNGSDRYRFPVAKYSTARSCERRYNPKSNLYDRARVMSIDTMGLLAQAIRRQESLLLESWLVQLLSRNVRRDGAGEAATRQQAGQLIQALASATESGGDDISHIAWSDVRRLLSELSSSRVRQGFSTTETALFVFSLKEHLFALLRATELPPDVLAQALIDTGMLLDQLGLFTVEQYQNSREQVIARQQQELLELSTPVIQLWTDVLAIPLIGSLDSARTQVVMENLLQKIVETGACVAVIDITGVPTVDTLVAQHLLKTVAAAKLMGAECIISGIRPHIAQTIVHLGVDLEDVVTKATLADAFAVALQRIGAKVSSSQGA